MADIKQARENPEEQLWEEIDDINAGMLGVEGSGQHMQPMSPYCDREANRIWFFANRRDDIPQHLGTGAAHAHFCVTGKSHDYHACIAGSLRVNTDRTKVEEFWNPVAAAWYDQGKDDPDLVLLELALEDAAIWASSGNPLVFAWQIAKANLTDDKADLGARNHIRFAA